MAAKRIFCTSCRLVGRHRPPSERPLKWLCRRTGVGQRSGGGGMIRLNVPCLDRRRASRRSWARVDSSPASSSVSWPAPCRVQISRMISSSAFPRAQPIAAAICVLNICLSSFHPEDMTAVDGRHGFPVPARINLADRSALA
ncbi:hypothetical protein CHELA40_60023 [Chelatococcus asaccharovorans]|nr:hypothetical protein CHELA17_30006 [Chelatococcus asaccharovorans]CAH1695148.1 hypothetical protein CHELA40_60023 [Chelatococcus asaccharovorans]CAH1696664.1 hypothetical protein CHELA1G2_50003 [Hyphomicrobiales bacterium]